MSERHEFWAEWLRAPETANFRKLRVSLEGRFAELLIRSNRIASGDEPATMESIAEVKALALLAQQARYIYLIEGKKLPDRFQPQFNDVLAQVNQKLDGAFEQIVEYNSWIELANTTNYPF